MQITEKHATDPTWGNTGEHYLDMVVELAHCVKATSILDYGCGKGTLLDALDAQYEGEIVLQGYDPAITKFGLDPEPADLVLCTDVLEHIEPDCIDAVLAHLRSLTKIGAFLVIHTGPASHKLPDGRNAHLIQQPLGWWFTQIAPYFHLEKVQPMGEHTFAACCVPWSQDLIDQLKANAMPISDEQLEVELKNRIAAAESVGGHKVKCEGLLGRFKA